MYRGAARRCKSDKNVQSVYSRLASLATPLITASLPFLELAAASPPQWPALGQRPAIGIPSGNSIPVQGPPGLQGLADNPAALYARGQAK